MLWKTDDSGYGKRRPRFTAWKAIGILFEGDRVELEFSLVYKLIEFVEGYVTWCILRLDQLRLRGNGRYNFCDNCKGNR